MLTEGQSFTDIQYDEALEIRDSLSGFFDNFFEDFDAILSPSASGEAPLLNEGHTGNPVFCTVWTLAGLPCLNLPDLARRTWASNWSTDDRTSQRRRPLIENSALVHDHAF